MCFPATTDTFGNVVLEAQASGLPVVVSDSGGPKELVAHKANGLITRSHNVEDFTDAIRALVTNQTLPGAHGDLPLETALLTEVGLGLSKNSGLQPRFKICPMNESACRGS